MPGSLRRCRVEIARQLTAVVILDRGETMTKKDLIAKEIEQIPEPLLEEVLDFVRFLKTKRLQEKLESSMLSEPVLKQDWLKPEEDEAWRDL
jgi:hypothetical protein